MRKKDKKEENKDIVCVKCSLNSIVRGPFQTLITNYISDKSVKSTKICIVASLLFLELVQCAYETNHYDFFNHDGKAIIRDCFYTILRKNIRQPQYMTHEFREMNANDQYFQWPDNDYFGNAFGDLIDTYVTNVKNNLKDHCAARLREYLKMKVHQNNSGDYRFIEYYEYDIKTAVNWATKRRDMKVTTIHQVANRERRNYLLEMVSQKSLFEINDNNIMQFTTVHWFKSIQMWISMQREIYEYNASWNGFRGGQPKIKNLCVIPICHPTRTHYPMDSYTFYKLMCETGLIPRRNGNQISDAEVRRHRDYYWNQIFNVNKIKRMVRSKKKFDFRILSDGVAVSIQYKQKKRVSEPISDEQLRQKLMNGEIECELGIDPGLKTFNATVRRDVITQSEVNIKTSAAHFHWNAYYKKRQAKRKRWTREYLIEEHNEMNNRNLYTVTPSPLGPYWRQYILFRMRMLERSLEVYGTPQYTRLSLDKHIETNREIDAFCAKLVGYRSAIVYFGSATISPQCPFKIKKHVRAPFARRIMAGFRKRGNVYVKPTNEDFSSQTCAECLQRFDRRTINDRFKVCQNCHPNIDAMLPSKIVTQVGKRDLQQFRQLDVLHNPGNLMSKVQVYRKNWQLNPAAGEMHAGELQNGERLKKTVWHRDIAAAKCILIIGHCTLFKLPIPAAFVRQDQQQQQQQ